MFSNTTMADYGVRICVVPGISFHRHEITATLTYSLWRLIWIAQPLNSCRTVIIPTGLTLAMDSDLLHHFMAVQWMEIHQIHNFMAFFRYLFD